jgi:hypothetical protein
MKSNFKTTICMVKSINLPPFKKALISLNLMYNIQNLLKTKTLLWLLFFLLAPVAGAMAQVDEEETTEGDSQNYDYYDENIDGGSYDYDYNDAAPDDAPKKAPKKPYVRIKMPIDSISELITYDSVIVQDESYYDSLYIRAKRWVTTKWFPDEKAKNLPKLFAEDVQYEKFKVKLTLPMKVRYNKFSVDEYGKIEFNLTMRFKDGKFRYTITNLVHQLPETSDKKDINYVYMEYYMKSERNIVGYDRFLRGADGALRKIVTEMAKAMREPVEVDDDDW